MEVKREVYGEVYRLSIDPKILIQSHLMIEFEKEQEARNVAQGLKSRHKEFGVT